MNKDDASGYKGTKITRKSDEEPSILVFNNAVALKREAPTGLIESPVRESKSNAHVERAIRTWRDKFRTLRHYLEHRLKTKIGRDSAISSWLTSWAAEVLNRFKVQANGRTSYEMMTQHRCRHKVAAFGEKVHFQPHHLRPWWVQLASGIFWVSWLLHLPIRLHLPVDPQDVHPPLPHALCLPPPRPNQTHAVQVTHQ